MTNRKPTKREMLTETLNILNEAEARQKNAHLMGAIIKTLEDNDKPMSISQLMADPALTDLKSNQHCNSLLIMMRMGGAVQRIEGKDGAMFTITGREVTAKDEVGDENTNEVVVK